MAKSRSFTSLTSLDDLAQLKQSLELARIAKEEAEKLQAQAIAEQARLRHEAEEQARKDASLFQEFAKKVTPLPNANRVVHTDNKPDPVPRPHSVEHEPKTVVLSDGWDVSTMLDTSEFLSYRKSGVSSESLRQMRKGKWRIQAQLDLHGFRTDEARTAVSEFIEACSRDDIRCVRIIPGKGLSSLDNQPVLKDKVCSWLVQKPQVTAFCQAPEHEGGAGALLILLKSGSVKTDLKRKQRTHQPHPNQTLEQKQNRRHR